MSLHISGDTLDPDRITRMLGVPPTLAGRKGERIEEGGEGRTRSVGTWSLALPVSVEWELGDAIRTLLDRFPPDPALWEGLASEFRTEVLCGLFLHASNRNAELSIETMALLVERRLTLILDIHRETPTG